MKTQLHEFYVTRKCTKMEYFTVKAESMEEAEWEAENGNEYFDFDWEEFDFETQTEPDIDPNTGLPGAMGSEGF